MLIKRVLLVVLVSSGCVLQASEPSRAGVQLDDTGYKAKYDECEAKLSILLQETKSKDDYLDKMLKIIEDLNNEKNTELGSTAAAEEMVDVVYGLHDDIHALRLKLKTLENEKNDVLLRLTEVLDRSGELQKQKIAVETQLGKKEVENGALRREIEELKK